MVVGIPGYMYLYMYRPWHRQTAPLLVHIWFPLWRRVQRNRWKKCKSTAFKWSVLCCTHTHTHISYIVTLHTLVQMFRVYALYSWGMISKNSFRKGWGVMGRFWGKVPRKVEGFGGRFQITLWEGSEKLWKRSHRRIAHWQFFSNIINSSCCLAYDLILFRLCLGQHFQREMLGNPLGGYPRYYQRWIIKWLYRGNTGWYLGNNCWGTLPRVPKICLRHLSPIVIHPHRSNWNWMAAHLVLWNPMDVTWSDLLWLIMIGTLKNWTLLPKFWANNLFGVENGNSFFWGSISVHLSFFWNIPHYLSMIYDMTWYPC